MRLTKSQIESIRKLTSQIAGKDARVRVFGSRLDDTARGGDLDLMLELTETVDNPALIAARMAALVSRMMHGRKVDRKNPYEDRNRRHRLRRTLQRHPVGPVL